MDLREILSRFDVKRGPRGEDGYYECRCPAHDDRKASLIIGPGETGVRVKCLANCQTEDVLAAVGLSMRDLFYDSERKTAKTTVRRPVEMTHAPKAQGDRPGAKPAENKAALPRRVDRVYPYTDESGKTVFEVVRYVPKDFRQRVPDPGAKGGYRWSIKGVRQVIYHLPQVLAAIREGRMIFVVEGEKDADNMALIGAVATTCAMGAGKWHREHSEYLTGADVCILPDNDAPGREHAEQVMRQLLGIAKSVRVLDIVKACPSLPEKGDVSDMIDILGKADTARILHELIAATEPAQPPEQSPYDRALELYGQVGGYGVQDGGVVAYGKESIRRLSTFVALPTKIITKDDGVTVEKYFEIEGWTKNGHQLPTISVKADDFGGMGWVLRNWDFAANVMPGNAIKEQLRYVMTEVGNQSASRETVYTHTGWRKIGGKWVYLYPGGAIGAEGIRVEMENALSRYGFNSELEEEPMVTMALAHEFKDAMSPHVSIPLLGVAFLAPLREFLEIGGHMPRFAVWLKGDSGVRKTTASALALSFYGNFRYSDPMPASFHDTANSIRRKAFVLKDSLLVVDDFHPETNLQERRRMESLVQALSRAYGNGDSRGRMTSERKLEDAMPSRGLAIMSGEQAPDVGPSGATRFYMITVERGDIEINEQLEAVQELASQGYLRKAMADYIAWIGQRADKLIGTLPDMYVKLRKQAAGETASDANGRAAEAAAHIMLGYEMMLCYMSDIGAITKEQAEAERAEAWRVIMDNSRGQTDEAREIRPVNMFLTAVQQLLASKQATVRDISEPNPNATPPSSIGYCDQQYYYLFPDVVFARVCKLYSDQAVVFPLGKSALFKQLGSDGVLVADGSGKATRTKRIGNSVMRLLWLDRRSVDGNERRITMPSGEQIGMSVVADDENPFTQA